MVRSRTLGKVFLVSLSSRFNLRCSPRRAQLQRGAPHQRGAGLGSGRHRAAVLQGTRAQRAGPGKGMSPGTCDGHSSWIYSSHSRSSASVPRRAVAGTWWTELSQVPSQLPATTDHAVSKPVYEQKGTLISHPHGLVGREGSIPWWATLEPVPSLVMAKKEQARYPSWHTAGIGRQWTCTLFCFLQHVSYPSLFFLAISVRTREMAKLLVRSVSLMTHQALQSQNRLLVLERYKTTMSFLWLLYKTLHICTQGNILKPHIAFFCS